MSAMKYKFCSICTVISIRIVSDNFHHISIVVYFLDSCRMWLSPRILKRQAYSCLPANTTVTTLGSSVSSTALGRGERYIPVYPVPGSPYAQQAGATPSNRQMSNVSTPSPAATRHYRTPPPPPSDQVLFWKHDLRQKFSGFKFKTRSVHL